MRKPVSLLLCLSIGFFAMARATNSPPVLTADANAARQKPTPQRADAENLLTDACMALTEEDTDENGTSDQEGEEINDDDNGDAGDEDTSEDDGDEDDSGNGGGNEEG